MQLLEAAPESRPESLESTISQAMSRIPSRLFKALYSARPNVVANEELIGRMWGPDSKVDPETESRIYTNVRRLRSILAAAQTPNRCKITHLFKAGYFLTEETPQCQEKLAAIKRTPPHEAENAATLAQILMLNGIRFRPQEAKMLSLLLKKEEGLPYEELARDVFGDDHSRRASLSTCFKSIKKVLGGKEINGYAYYFLDRSGMYVVRKEKALDRYKAEILEEFLSSGISPHWRIATFFRILLGNYPKVCNPNSFETLWQERVNPISCLRATIYLLWKKLSETGLDEKCAIEAFTKLGYTLVIKTPKGREELERLRAKPIHEAEDIGTLARMLSLNGVSLVLKDLETLTPLLKDAGKPVGIYILAGTSLQGSLHKRENVAMRVGRLRRTLGGREINGYTYDIIHEQDVYTLRISRTETPLGASSPVPQISA